MIKRIISLTMAITAVCAVFCSAFNVCATDTDLTVTLASVKEVEELSYGEYSLKYADMPHSLPQAITRICCQTFRVTVVSSAWR